MLHYVMLYISPSMFSLVLLPCSQERKLCAFPTIEICSSDVINYMVPLSRQTDFFVPEMKDEVKTDVKEEDSDEDRGTDITGNILLIPIQTLLLPMNTRQEFID